MATTSLLDWVLELQRQAAAAAAAKAKAEAEAKAKAAAEAAAKAAAEAKAKASAVPTRLAKDDVYTPPTSAAVDDRQQAIAEKRADVASLVKPPAYDVASGTLVKPPAYDVASGTLVKAPLANKTYLPFLQAQQEEPTYTADKLADYGPPAPTASSSASSPATDALQSWRQKPTDNESLFRYEAQPYKAPEVGLSFDRPDTGATDIGASSVTQVQPQQQQAFDPNRFGEKPDTRSFLQANALAGSQPYANYAVGAQANLHNALELGGGLLKWGLNQWGNPQQQPQTQQAGQTPLNQTQPLNTGAGAIGATGQTSDTLGINIGGINQQAQQPASQNWLNQQVQKVVQPLAGTDPEQAWKKWYSQTPSGQYVLPRLEQREGFLGALENAADVANIPYQLASQTRIPGSGALTGGTDVSAGQVGSAVGTVVNRAINPFSDQSVYQNQQNRETDTGEDWSKQHPILNEYVPLQALGWAADTFKQNLNQALKTNRYLDNLPADQKNKVQIALNNVWSGPWSVQKTIDDIQNQQKNAQNYTQLAQQQQAIANDPTKSEAERQQAALKAAQYGNQANETKNYSALDYVDANKHPGPELVADLLFNPVNYAANVPIEKGVELFKGWQYARLFNVTPEAAEKIIPKALEEADKIIQAGIARQAPEALTDAGSKTPILLRNAWEKINPLAPTIETKAQNATTTIWDSLAQVIGKAQNKQDAQALVTAFVQDPLKLVQGIAGMTSPDLLATADQGLTKVGAGVVANKKILEQYPILKLAADKLLGSESLAGEGAFNAKSFMVEAEKALYDTAREAFGGGATGGGGAATKALGALDYAYKLQKGIISDMYLSLNPANWIRNGASGMAHLTVDGLSNLVPKEEMIKVLESKLGMVPERGLFNALAGNETDIAHWSEKLFGTDNPYAKLVQAGSDVRGGFNTLGNVPVGENAMRLLAYYNGFQRMFGKAFKGAVTETFEKGLVNAGVDADLAKTLGHIATEAGVAGDKTGLVTAVRDALTNKTLKPNLRELGIHDELISMEGWSKIHDVLANYGPEQAEEAANGIKQIFTDELKNRAKILNESPTQLGNYKWTNTQASQDSASLIDNLRKDAAAAGIPKDQAEQQIQAIAKQFGDASQNAWQVFRDDLKAAQNPQEALHVIFDTYAQHTALTDQARAAVDELGRYAASLPSGSPERAAAWGQKWQKTQETYTKLADDVNKLFTGTRAKLAGVADEAAPAFDWWKAIERYTNYDEAAVQSGRTAGLGLGAPGAENAAQYQQAINANRQYVDKSLLELYDAFRRNPTQESMDMLVHAQGKIQEMGAQVAAHLDSSLQDALAGKLPWDEYYKLKAQTWHEFFDNAVAHNKAVQRYVVADGVTSQYKQFLTWEDPFYGPMRLIAPDSETVVNATSKAKTAMEMNTGVRQARSTDFSVWQVMGQDGKLQTVSDQYVPEQVKQAWDKIVNSDGDVQKVMDDIAQTVQPYDASSYIPDQPINAQEVIDQQGGKTATELANEKLAQQKAAAAAQAQPAAPVQQYGPVDNPNRGGIVGIRRTAEGGDEPVSILGKAYTRDGVDYYSISGTPEKVPANQLYMLNKENKLYKLTDVGAIKQAEQAAGRATEEIGGLEQARTAMRDEWNRIAKGEKEYLKLDSAAMLYNKGGIVNVPPNKFEDLYGVTIAGHRIESQADVEAFIQSYVDMQAQIKAATKASKEAGTTYKAMKLNYEEAPNANDIRAAVKQWNPFGLEPGEAEAAATKAATPVAEAAPVAAPVAEAAPVGNPIQEQINKVVADNTSRSLAQNGNKAPEVSQVMGSHMIEKLQQAEQQIMAQLPNILAGKPNTLTEAQRVGAMDLLQKLLGGYDNAVMQGKASAEAGMNFAMLNYNDRRNIDSILGYVFPYHFYYTRSGINWAVRALQKPGVLHAYNEVNKAIALENQQQNLPTRLQGTIPNPAAQFGIGPDRLGNPLTWLLPIASYAGSDYVDPEDANTDYERWYLSIKKFAPSMAPLLDAGINYGLDQVAPKADGEKRFQAANYAPNKFIPAMDLAGYAVQAATGKTAAQMADMNAPTYGDQFDPYRLGRSASVLAAQQHLDPRVAQYAQQIALNTQNGADQMDKIPLEYQQQAIQLYTAAAKDAAKQRLWAKGMGFLTGVPGYNYSPEERQLNDANAEIKKLGYGPDNPYGSKEAMDAAREQTPYLQPWNTKSALVPSTDATYQPMAPAQSAQNTSKAADKEAIQTQMNAAVEKYLKANPNASTKDVMAIKQPFLDQVKALDAKYPDAGYPEGNGGPPKGMNPKERAQWQLDQLLYGSNAGAPPRPPDGATPEQLQAYYKAKAEFAEKQLNQIESSANSVFAESGEPGQDWQTEFKALVKGKYAVDLLHDSYLRDVSQTERDWSKRQQLQSELVSAQMQGNVDAVKARMGDKVAAVFDEYRKLPKEGDAREKFKAQHPELAAANIAAYDPQAYDALTKQFGANAWQVYANKPAYPGDNATEAQKAQYKKAMANYEAHNPQYGDIALWVNGRPRKYEQAPEGMIAERNYGQDYQEAVKIFGPNIFKVVAGYPGDADGKTKAAYYKAHPELSGYWQWYNEVKDKPPTYVKASEAGGPVDLSNYDGPRPIGSDHQPIGLYPGEEGPKGWDLSKLTPATGAAAPGAAPTGPTKTAKEYTAESDAAYREDYKKKYGHYPAAGGGGQFGDDWSAYNKLSKDAKAQYMRDHPDFAKYYSNKYGNEWWNKAPSKNAVAYKEARAGVAQQFGEDAAKTWEAYGKLPKDSKAREDYRAAHPELKIFDMAGYNPKEFEAATKLFGKDAWTDWAAAPKSGKTDEEKAARNAYMDEHPVAKLLNAWIYGRPSAQGEQEPGAGVKYNFGADFEAAKKQFGDDIWNVFGGYKSAFNKDQKKAYLGKYPQLTKFFDWWYGNDRSGGARAAYGRGGGYGGYRGGYGGGFSYGGGGGGGGHDNPPQVYAREMAKDLIINAPQQAQQWHPSKIDLSWLHASDWLAQDKLGTWKKH